jgi:undecaprenyl-phosphate galactose phosphotransferase/putative colanic acid biosynthesis UDP-glucose lipid carrier transferase
MIFMSSSVVTPLSKEYQQAVRAHGTRRYISFDNIWLITVLSDCILIITASVISAVAYHLIALNGAPDIKQYFGIGSVSALIYVSLVASRKLYRVHSLSYFPGQTKQILLPWLVVVGVCTLVLFLFKSGANYSRGSLAIFSAVALGALIGSRYIIAHKLTAALLDGSLSAPRAIIIGDAEFLSQLPAIQVLRRWGLREVGRSLLPNGGDLRRDITIVDAAIEAARLHNVQFVLLALKWSNRRRRELISDRLQILPVPVLLLPDDHIRHLLAQGTRQIGSELAVEVQRAPLSTSELAIKRTMDLVMAGAILVATAPLLALVSLAIKLDSTGPVIFRQRRRGFNGREFAIYKFRTMNVMEDGHEMRQAQRNDGRVTRVGRILRTTSIDELPQLVNVICGQMSLVGPRPHPVALDNGCSKLIANYAFRQHVKPGLTGWAQIKGFRGETAKLELMEERVAHDLWYVKNWSIWLDFRIIVRTCFVLLRPKNAY